jgi:ribosome-associated protein
MDMSADAGAALAVEICRLLAEHKAEGVAVLDMRPLDYWTDFFVIAAAPNAARLSGLERLVRDFAAERSLPRRSPTRIDGDEWRLIDLGGLVVHLMTPRTREFYELERLWSQAKTIYTG